MRHRLVMGIVLANYPTSSAGHQLSVLHWLWGFEELGWDVWVVESLRSRDCRDATGKPCVLRESVQFANWCRFLKDHHLVGRATLFVDGAAQEVEAFRTFAEGADLFLNYAGRFDLLDEIRSVGASVYLDVDPGYTQVWALGYGCDMNLDAHDFHVTIGSAHSQADCRIPRTGHDWIPTLPPVSLPFYERAGWRKRASHAEGAWTTVTHWYGAADVEIGGLTLRGKRESFLSLADLPSSSPRPILVASDLAGDWEDYPTFVSRGWRFRSVRSVCSSMNTYLGFIAASFGEIGIAKEGFCTARTGWLSDRSLAYLACGRPVVAQDTGWTRLVGEHAGLRAFTTAEEALVAMAEIEADYQQASLSALQVSRQIFAAPRIISRLLSGLGIAGGFHPTKSQIAIGGFSIA